MYKTDLREFDVLPPKLFPDVLGPPANLDWTRPWHHILHDLNCRNSDILKATSERIQAVEGNLTPKYLAYGTLERITEYVFVQ